MLSNRPKLRGHERPKVSPQPVSSPPPLPQGGERAQEFENSCTLPRYRHYRGSILWNSYVIRYPATGTSRSGSASACGAKSTLLGNGWSIAQIYLILSFFWIFIKLFEIKFALEIVLISLNFLKISKQKNLAWFKTSDLIVAFFLTDSTTKVSLYIDALIP